MYVRCTAAPRCPSSVLSAVDRGQLVEHVPGVAGADLGGLGHRLPEFLGVGGDRDGAVGDPAVGELDLSGVMRVVDRHDDVSTTGQVFNQDRAEGTVGGEPVRIQNDRAPATALIQRRAEMSVGRDIGTAPDAERLVLETGGGAGGHPPPSPGTAGCCDCSPTRQRRDSAETSHMMAVASHRRRRSG